MSTTGAPTRRMTVRDARNVALTHDASDDEVRAAIARLGAAGVTARNLSYLAILEATAIRRGIAQPHG